MRNIFCAVVVTFNPDPDAFFGLQSDLVAEDIPYVVVDNGSIRKPNALNAELVIWNDQNLGLGAALNAGIGAVKQRGYPNALLLDQDSRLLRGFSAGMRRAMAEVDALGVNFSAVGPMLRNPETYKDQSFRSVNRLFSRKSRRVAGAKGLYLADFLITSGTVLPLDAYAEIGQMREDYFIDNIDLEWCFRAQSKGYQAYGTNYCKLLHRIGEGHSNVLVRRGWVSLHAPNRIYYSTRNRFHLYRQPYAGWLWKLRDFSRFLLKTSVLLMVSKQRKNYFKNIIAGLRDAQELDN